MWDLVPWPGIKPRPPALGAQSHSHWTTSIGHTHSDDILRSIPYLIHHPSILSTKLYFLGSCPCIFLLLLINRSSCARCTVRLNNLKCWSWSRERFIGGSCMGNGWVRLKKTPKLPVFRVVFTGKIWGEGETVYLSLGLESSPNPRNLVLGPNEVQVLEVSLQKEFSER